MPILRSPYYRILVLGALEVPGGVRLTDTSHCLEDGEELIGWALYAGWALASVMCPACFAEYLMPTYTKIL